MVLCHCGCLGFVFRVPAVKDAEEVVFSLVWPALHDMLGVFNPLPVSVSQQGVPIAFVVCELLI